MFLVLLFCKVEETAKLIILLFCKLEEIELILVPSHKLRSVYLKCIWHFFPIMSLHWSYYIWLVTGGGWLPALVPLNIEHNNKLRTLLNILWQHLCIHRHSLSLWWLLCTGVTICLLVAVGKFDTLKASSIRCLSSFTGWHDLPS